MTIEEAIQHMEYYCRNTTFPQAQEAYRMALAALCAQQEAKKNVPLTLDDLKEMDGQPVWIVPGANCFGNCPPHWRIWNEHEYYDFECFKAYRRPPVEEET